MIEGLFELWSNVPWIIRWPINFWFVFIFLRGVIASTVTDWMIEKGLMQKGKSSPTWKVLDFIYNTVLATKAFIKKHLLSTERKQIFFEHEVNRHGQSLEVCTKDNCRLLA